MSAVPLRGLPSILLVLGIVLVLAETGFSVMRVSGNSMNPGLKSGDRVLVFRLAYGLVSDGEALIRWGRVKRGQIVVLESEATRSTVIKRVVAAPGDEFLIAHGRLRVAGRELLLDGNLLKQFSGLSNIPEDTLLVAGDRGSQSYDSRHYGLVPIKALRGRVIGVQRAR